MRLEIEQRDVVVGRLDTVEKKVVSDSSSSIESGMKAGKETYSSERMSRSVAILTRLLEA